MQSKQPYKYNGKELEDKHGLNLYDYAARHMEPAIGRFTTVDPMAEKYYSISPYAYVGNNPIRIIDPTGKDWFVDGETGNIHFFRGVSNLNKLDDKVAKAHGIDKSKISNYENLGKDEMFGKNIGFGDNKNLLNEASFAFGTDSENFMESQGYGSVDRVRVESKERTQPYMDGSFGQGSYSVHESEQIIGRYKSYAKEYSDYYKGKNIKADVKHGLFGSYTDWTTITDYKVPTGSTTYKGPQRTASDTNPLKVAGETAKFGLDIFLFFYETFKATLK